MDESAEEVYLYPPNTPGSDSEDGIYLHRLSPQSRSILNVLQRWVIDNQIDVTKLNPSSLHPTLTLLRYLRANGFDADKAIEHMERNLQWRAENKVDQLVKMDPEQVLGCRMPELTEVFPHWHATYDKTGRPVLFKQYGKFDAAKVKELTGGSFDNLARYHTWEQEMCIRLCTQSSHNRGVLVETFSAVMDLQGMRVPQITRDFLSMTRLLADIDKNQYPESLGQIYIINCPAAFPMVWRWIKPFLDPVVATKILIMGSREEYEPVLYNNIGREYLPSNYGGTMPALSSDVHPYSEIMSSLALADGDRSESANAIDLQREDPNSSSDSDLFMDAKEFGDDETKESGRRRQSRLLQILKHRVNSHNNSKVLYGSSTAGHNGALLNARSYRNWTDELNYLKNINRGPRFIGDNLEFDDEESEPPPTATAAAHAPTRNRVAPCWQGFDRAILRRMIPEAWFTAVPTKKLSKYLLIAIGFYLLGALAAMAVGVTALTITTGRWVSSLAKLQLWAGVLMMLVSSIMVVFNFIGYLSVRLKNRPLLLLYAAGLIFGSLVFLVVAVASFLYYFVPSALGVTETALDRLPNTAKTILDRYNLMLAVGSSVASIGGVFPLWLSLVLAHRLEIEQGEFFNPLNIQVVLRVASSLSIACAIVMIGYGADSLRYLFKIGYTPTVFYVFGLVYGGVAVLISSAVGFWSSTTIHKSVLFIYYAVILPVLIVSLLIIAVLCFTEVPRSDNSVEKAYRDLSTSDNEGVIKTRITTQLLVAGVLALFVCVFQTSSLIAVRVLHRLVDSIVTDASPSLNKDYGGNSNARYYIRFNKQTNDAAESRFWSEFSVKNAVRFYVTHSRGRKERLLMTWAVVMGLFDIFMTGTFVIFSGTGVSELKQVWVTSVWRLMGKADSRFVENDSYLVTSAGINSLLVGPMLLVYAWTTFVRAPQRHVLGVLPCTVQIYSWVLFYSMEIHAYLHGGGRTNAIETVWLVIASSILYIIFPLLVFVSEVRTLVQDTARHDYNEMLNDTGSSSFARGGAHGALGSDVDDHMKLMSLSDHNKRRGGNGGSKFDKKPIFNYVKEDEDGVDLQQSPADKYFYREENLSDTATALSWGEFPRSPVFLPQPHHRRRPSLSAGSWAGEEDDSFSDAAPSSDAGSSRQQRRQPHHPHHNYRRPSSRRPSSSVATSVIAPHSSQSSAVSGFAPRPRIERQSSRASKAIKYDFITDGIFDQIRQNASDIGSSGVDAGGVGSSSGWQSSSSSKRRKLRQREQRRAERGSVATLRTENRPVTTMAV